MISHDNGVGVLRLVDDARRDIYLILLKHEAYLFQSLLLLAYV
jgi:hypothetical protein